MTEKERAAKLNMGSLYGKMSKEVDKIEVPDFLKKNEVKRKLYDEGIIEPTDEELKKLSRTVQNDRYFLTKQYEIKYPETCMSFVIPNSYLEDDIKKYYGLSRRERIEKLLARSDAYAIITHKENRYKLFNAVLAYKLSSKLLSDNKGKKNSIRKTKDHSVTLSTVVNIIEEYRATPNSKFRKLK